MRADTGLGSRVRELRRRRGLSQAELAGSRLSESYVSLIESGRRNPTEEVVAYLARALQCSVSELSGEQVVPSASHAELMVRRAELEMCSGNPTAALSRFEESAFLSESIDAPHLLHRSLAGSARCLELLGRLDGAVAAWRGLLDKSRQDPVNGFESAATVGLCRCLREAGELHESVEVGEAYWTSARPGLGSPAPEEVLVVGATLLMAYLELDDVDRATTLSADLVELADGPVTQRARGAIYWNAALVAEAAGRVAEAVGYAEQAKISFAETEDVRNRARLQVALGGLYLREDPPNHVEAVRLLMAAEPVLRQFGSIVDVAYCRTELARAHLQLGGLKEALDLALDAAGGFDPAAVPLQVGRSLMVAASACHALGDEESALTHAHRAAELLEAAGANVQAASRWTELAEIYVAVGDKSAALESYRHATQLLGAKPTAGRLSGEQPSARDSRTA